MVVLCTAVHVHKLYFFTRAFAMAQLQLVHKLPPLKGDLLQVAVSAMICCVDTGGFRSCQT